MVYLENKGLLELGLKKLGENVKISSKASIYDAETIEIGDNSRIDDFCVISGNVRIGRNVHIAPFCLVAGGEPGITFEDFSGLAYHVQVFSQSDDYSGETLTNPTVPDHYKAETKAPVHLGRHVIIGAGSVILPGTIVAEGCAVGTMSLVRGTTEPWGIYLGIPARRMQERSKALLSLETAYLKQEGQPR